MSTRSWPAFGSPAAAGFTAMDEGALRGKANEINVATVTLHDVLNQKVNYGGDSIQAIMRSPSGLEVQVSIQDSIQDNNDGTYLITHKPSETGSHLLHVFFNQRQIKGSPFNVQIGVTRSYEKIVSQSVVFGGFGSDDGLMNMPWGLAIDQNDRIYVSDR